nr:integrase, catalytic region, zinc finger, CCHC-type, peptidase aspartic, catalytic [Tanacetum cinerariifolium]
MSRDVITVGSTMRIPLLYWGEYSQWHERFMNYLEEQTDGEAMINSLRNGLLELHRMHLLLSKTQSFRLLKRKRFKRLISANKKQEFVKTDDKKVEKKDDEKKRGMSKVKCYNCKKEGHFAKDCKKAKMCGSEYGEQDQKATILYEYETFKFIEEEQLLDTYLCYLQVINDLKKCGYKKDNCKLNYKFLNNLQPEWKQYGTLMRQTKNLIDINIDAFELKKITALLAKAFNQRKFYSKPTNNNLKTSSTSQSTNKKQEFVKMDDKKVEKKADEKKRDMSKVKCYNCKKEGHFAKDYKKAKVKDYNHYKTKMLLAKKDSDEQVLLAEDQAWMESNSDSDQEINANMVFMAQIEEVIGLGYTLMFLTHSNEALEIKKYKKFRENKIKFAYDYGNLNASYVNEKINFKDDYFQEIINPGFEKIDSLFQQTSSLKPYVSNVILEKIIIDLEDKVVSLLKKDKANLKTIESLKSKGFESSENVIPESENQSENDCLVVEKECDKVENSKVIAPGMFKLSVSKSVSPISMTKTSCESKNVESKLKRKRRKRKSSKQNDKQVNNDVSCANSDFVYFSDLDTFSSVRRPKNSGVIWKKKWSSNTSNVDLSAVSPLKLNKNVKRYCRKDLLSCNNSHLGETSSAYVCNDAMNVSCNPRMCDLLDDNNFFIFDDKIVRISPVSKMPFRKKPHDSMNVCFKSNSNKSLRRTMHKWLPKLQPLPKLVAKWIPRIVQICLWIIDSGCSKHMMGNRALLTNFVEKFLGTVRFGNNDFVVIATYGDVVIGSMTIKKVYYVEGLGHNLFSEIINLDFEKIDSPFQQTSSLKPYVPNVILEKIIIDLEDKVVNLLEKEKVNLETIETLKSKSFESSEKVSFESENQSENDCLVIEKDCDKEENPKVIAPWMFKLNVSQYASPISMSKSSCNSNNVEIKLKRKRRKRKSSKQNVKQVDNDVSRANSDFVHFSDLDTFSSVRRLKIAVLFGRRKGRLILIMLVCLLMNDLLDDNNLFIFDDVNVRISLVSKIPFRKKPSDSMHICVWIIDSGCSKHMTGNRALLTNFVEKFLGTVRFGNNDFTVIAGFGDVVIGSMTIKKVYYVEGLGHNFFSVGQFYDRGLEVAFRKSTCFVRNEDGVDLLTGDCKVLDIITQAWKIGLVH